MRKKDGNIKVITLESNLRSLIDIITPWSYSFAGGAAAVAFLLRNNMRMVYKSSSFQDGQVSGPTDGVLNQYFQTERLSLIHDGGEASRIEKIKAIAKSNVVLDHLRVCYMNKQGVYNCGTCDKCLRTMIGLRIAGKLDKVKTFPHEINIEHIKTLRVTNRFGAIFHKENLAELQRLGIEKELQEAIKTCLQTPAKDSVFTEYYAKAAFIDHMYLRGTLRKLHSLVKATK